MPALLLTLIAYLAWPGLTIAAGGNPSDRSNDALDVPDQFAVVAASDDIRCVKRPILSAKSLKPVEGWVELGFMVDATGVPYEIAVLASSGNPDVENHAIRGVGVCRFPPGVLGDRAVEYSLSLIWTFAQPGFRTRWPALARPGARPTFQKRYRLLSEALREHDRSRADELLASMDATNLHEDAYLSIAWYGYHQIWGTLGQQRYALLRAGTVHRNVTGLRTRDYRDVRKRLFVLLVANNELADALLVWKALQRLALPKDEEEKLQATVTEIEALMASDRAFVVNGELVNVAYWVTRLFRNRFRIAVEEGAISKITLHCARGFYSFDYAPGLQYEIAPDAGPCTLRLIGEPSTRLRLEQS